MLQARAQNTPAPTPTSQTPAPPTAPEAPNSGLPAAITAASGSGNVFTMPRTAQELRAMRSMRDELSDQLQSAAGRRQRLAGEIQRADPAARPGLQARIQLLDQRILQIEQDIATTGALVARAQGQITSTGTPTFPGPFQGRNMDMTAISVVFTIFVLFPISFAIARSFWKRGSARAADPVIERENSERLARLEQAVDTIAVEMERVSEGQRFVTKLLSEAQKRDQQARIEARS